MKQPRWKTQIRSILWGACIVWLSTTTGLSFPISLALGFITGAIWEQLGVIEDNTGG